jgi:two-component system OmpR family response regulator
MERALKLLLVEEDSVSAAALSGNLGAFGHAVTVIDDVRGALLALGDESFEAMLLGRTSLPLDPVAFLRGLRGDAMTLPVIMLGASGRVVDKVEGLEAGADDYVVKPANAGELEARLKALLRARRWADARNDTISAGDIVVSPSRHRAWRAGKPLELGMLEFKLLAELVRNADMVVTRPMLLARVWNYDHPPATNVVEAHMSRLRARLTADGGTNPIKTLRGTGYVLRT